MSDRPVIRMGKNSGSSTTQSPPISANTNTQLPLVSSPVKKTKRIMGLLTRIMRVPKKFPALSAGIFGLLLLVLLPLLISISASPENTNVVVSTTIRIGVTPSSITPPSSLNDVIIHSIVSVVVYENGEPCSSGSGSVVGDGNLVLTNHHVIESDERCNIDEIRIQTVSDPAEFPKDSFIGKVIAMDSEADLALLSLEPMIKNPPVLKPLAIAVNPSIGDDVTALGFPSVGGDSVTISKGIVSGYVSIEGLQWMKTDAALSGGNSGGAALDSSFRLVAVPSRFSQSQDGNVTDCRVSADTNGDGVIDDDDSCVGVGGTFTLMVTIDTILSFALESGVDLAGSDLSNVSPTTTKKP